MAFCLNFYGSPHDEENRAVVLSWRTHKAEGSAGSPGVRPLTWSCVFLFHPFSSVPLKHFLKHQNTAEHKANSSLWVLWDQPLGPQWTQLPEWKVPQKVWWRDLKELTVEGKAQLEAAETEPQLPDSTSTSHSWIQASVPFKPGFPFKKSLSEM